MARADSTIRVNIIGDAKGLQSTLTKADRSIAGFSSGIVKGAVALGVVAAGFEFIQGATEEADRLGDAMARLNNQLGPGFTTQLESTAGHFAEIGASKQDILELEAIFADFGTAAGIADPTIAGMAESVAKTAQALTLTDDQGRDASAMMDLLNKAAGGSAKAAKELGVTLTDGLDPAAQMQSILGQLAGKVTDAESAQKDLEGQQSKLAAQWETLQAQIGGPLSEGLAAIVGFINDEIEAIPHAIEGFQKLGAAIEGMVRTVAAPLGNLNDLLGGIGDFFGMNHTTKIGFTMSTNDRALLEAVQREERRNTGPQGRD